MHWVNLAISAVSMIAGVVAAYFGYLAVRRELCRRRGESGRALPPESGNDGEYDVFISHADADAETAAELERRLRAAGLRTFRIVALGLVEYLEKERALLNSANGVLLFSRTTMSDPRIRDEYAALLQRVHSGGRRFVPVRIDDIDQIDLPPFAAIRRPLDLDPGGGDYNAQVAALVHAVRPHRPDPAG